MGKKPLTGLIGVFSIGILLTGCNCCRQNHKQYAGGAADGGMGLTSKWNTKPQSSQLAGSAGSSSNPSSGAGTSGSLSSQASGTAGGQEFGSTSGMGSSSASGMSGASPSSNYGGMSPSSASGLTSPSGGSGLTSPSGSSKTPSLNSSPTGPGLGMNKSPLGSSDGLSSNSPAIQPTSLTHPGSDITPAGDMKAASQGSDSPSVRDAAYRSSATDASALMGTNKSDRSLTVPAAPTPSSMAPLPTPPSTLGTKASSSSPSLPDATPSSTDAASSSPSGSGSGASTKTPESNSSYPPFEPK